MSGPFYVIATLQAYGDEDLERMLVDAWRKSFPPELVDNIGIVVERRTIYAYEEEPADAGPSHDA